MSARRWFAACFLCCSSSFGQLDRGAITGVLSDPSGAGVPNAQVRAIQVETNVSYPSVSTETGDYRIPALPAGE